MVNSKKTGGDIKEFTLSMFAIQKRNISRGAC